MKKQSRQMFLLYPTDLTDSSINVWTKFYDYYKDTYGEMRARELYESYGIIMKKRLGSLKRPINFREDL